MNLLAEMLEQGSKVEKLRSVFWMWAMYAAVGVLLVLGVWAIAAMRAARRKSGVRKPRRGKRIVDAWAEAGRRVEPIRMDEPPPEVLPEDRP